MRKSIFYILVCIMASTPVLCAGDSFFEKNHFWANAGLGFYAMSGFDHFDGFSSSVSLHYQNTPGSVISLGYSDYNEISFDFPSEYCRDFSLLYGYLYRIKWFNFSASSGVAYTYGRYRTKLQNNTSVFSDRYDSKNFKTIGLPVRVNAFFSFTPYTAAGIEYGVNLNTEKIVQSVNLCLQAGNLW